MTKCSNKCIYEPGCKGAWQEDCKGPVFAESTNRANHYETLLKIQDPVNIALSSTPGIEGHRPGATGSIGKGDSALALPLNSRLGNRRGSTATP